MPSVGGGFEQSYNAQAAVAAEACWWWRSMWRSPNDKQQLEPMLGKIEALPEEIGRSRNAVGGHGLFQRGECRGMRESGVEPLIAMGRQPPSSTVCKNASNRRRRRQKNPTPVEGWRIG